MGRSNQAAVFIDSSGRAFATDSHTLPSARSQGVSLLRLVSYGTRRNHAACMMGEEDQCYLLATDAGYGFICSYNDMVSRNKAGKAFAEFADKR